MQTKNLTRVIAALLAGALMISVGLNYIFYQIGEGYYKLLSRARLDPLGLADYPVGDDATLPAGEGRMRVVFFGDSRAYQWPAPEDLDGMEFINRGIGSQTSAQVLGRYDAHVRPLSADVIVIQVGINDLKTIPILAEQKQRIVEQCKANIEEIVRKSLAMDQTVILTTIIPEGRVPVERRPFWSNEVEAATNEVNRFLYTLEGKQVILLNTARVLANEDGKVRSEYSRDLLHLNDQGYAALNEALVIILRQIQDEMR